MTFMDPHYLSSLGARREFNLLVACSNPRSSSESFALRSLLSEDLDWTLLIEQALRHGVSPMVAKTLIEVSPRQLPEDLAEGLREHASDNALRNRSLLAALDETMQALRHRGILALAFKGQTLAARMLENYTLRRAGDLDLLVRKQDLSGVWAVLEDLEYREATEREIGRPMSAPEHRAYLEYQCEYNFTRERDHIMIEPHWAIAPRSLRIRLPYAAFWRDAERLSIDGRGIDTLSTAHLLLVVCVHASKHEWSRLQWIADVAGLVARNPELEVAEVLAIAREHGVERMVLVGLGLAHEIYGCILPKPVLRRFRADSELSHLILDLTRAVFEIGRKENSIWQVTSLRKRMRERWTDRLGYIISTLTTPIERHYRMVRIPAPLRSLYVPIKLGHDYLALPASRLISRLRPARPPSRTDNRRR